MDDDLRERKISRGLVRHVLTRNTGDRIALGRVTRQLDKERIAKELDYQQQKQKLLLQKFESQMKERSAKDSQETSNELDGTAGLRKATGKHVMSRYRSYSELEMSSSQLQRLKCSAEIPEALEKKAKTNRTLNYSRLAVEKRANETNRPRLRKTGVIKAPERSGLVEEVRMKRTKTLSDILPPVILPPIFQSGASSLEKRTVLENQRTQAKESFSEGSGSNQTPMMTEIRELEDLEDCRYLRKSNFQ